jgi:hypothetical protein
MGWGWTWDKGTPYERAEMVRGHSRVHSLSPCHLRQLFDLTEAGLNKILSGDDWCLEYEESSHANVRATAGKQTQGE